MPATDVEGKILLQGQDQLGLPLGHLRLEATLVEGFAQGSDATPGSAKCDETGPALWMVVSCCDKQMKRRVMRTRKAATATPAPIATADAMLASWLYVRGRQRMVTRCDKVSVGVKRIFVVPSLFYGISRLNMLHGPVYSSVLPTSNER